MCVHPQLWSLAQIHHIGNFYLHFFCENQWQNKYFSLGKIPQRYVVLPMSCANSIWAWTHNSPWNANDGWLSAHTVCSRFSPLNSAPTPSSSFPHHRGSSEPFSGQMCLLLCHILFLHWFTRISLPFTLLVLTFVFFLPRKCWWLFLNSVLSHNIVTSTISLKRQV